MKTQPNDKAFVFEPSGDNATLTKREYFAIKVLQGLVAYDSHEPTESLCENAVALADYLINELGKEV